METHPLQQQMTSHVLDNQSWHDQGMSYLVARCREEELTHYPAQLADSCHQKLKTCPSSDLMSVTRPDGNHVEEQIL